MISTKIVLFQLIYIIPSGLLYITEIYVMFFGARKIKFNKSSFNKLFAIYAVNNVVAESLYYFFFRMGSATVYFRLMDQLLGTHIYLGILWQLLFHTSMVTNLLDLVLSLNRFTAVIMPIWYNAIWINKIRSIIVFLILFPYICFWTFPFQEITLIHDNNSKTYYIDIQKPPPIEWPFCLTILGTCVTINCIICLFCNICVALRLCIGKSYVSHSHNQLERVYSFFTLCVFVIQLLSCSTQVTSCLYFYR